MKVTVIDQKGQEVSKVELNADVFEVSMNEGLVHRALVYQLSNDRQVVAHTKTRGERRGSTRKIYRQKGTGRARMGSNRSPIRKKGGVAFGPRNTVNFTLSMNKKERRKVIHMLLSQKAQNNKLLVLNKIELEAAKTKNMIEVFNNIPYQKNILLALAGKNEMIERSASNIPYAKTLLVDYLNVSDLLKYETLVLLEDSLEKVNVLSK